MAATSDKAMEGVAIAQAAQSPTLLAGEQGTMSVAMGGYGGHAALCLGGAMRLGDSDTQLFGKHGGNGKPRWRRRWTSLWQVIRRKINPLTASEVFSEAVFVVARSKENQ